MPEHRRAVRGVHAGTPTRRCARRGRRRCRRPRHRRAQRPAQHARRAPSPTRRRRRPRSRTANSSPPSRATRSVGPARDSRRAAISHTSSSPRSCPRVSLTSRNRSRSSSTRRPGRVPLAVDGGAPSSRSSSRRLAQPGQRVVGAWWSVRSASWRSRRDAVATVRNSPSHSTTRPRHSSATARSRVRADAGLHRRVGQVELEDAGRLRVARRTRSARRPRAACRSARAAAALSGSSALVTHLGLDVALERLGELVRRLGVGVAAGETVCGSASVEQVAVLVPDLDPRDLGAAPRAARPPGRARRPCRPAARRPGRAGSAAAGWRSSWSGPPRPWRTRAPRRGDHRRQQLGSAAGRAATTSTRLTAANRASRLGRRPAPRTVRTDVYSAAYGAASITRTGALSPAPRARLRAGRRRASRYAVIGA